MLEPPELEAFLTLAEELHFGRTADRLRVTTGRISQIISRLERRLGAALFERTSRTVTLTPIGRDLNDELLPAARQMRAALDHARNRARDLAHTLRAGYTEPWCGDLLLAAADNYLTANPGGRIIVREVHIHDGFQALRGGDIDLQLTELPSVETAFIKGPIISSEPRIIPGSVRTARPDSRGGVTLVPLHGARAVDYGLLWHPDRD
ncbi:LysR family transcriptional regulator [Nocardia sp. NPDC052001]|uniref:LysR family transcriptional regulator n=1 Tax=Nocardia sp. NPDC052001 TaxID=3154853 RepID=UPI00343155D3